MDELTKELISSFKGLQFSVYVNIALSAVALITTILVKNAITRANERFKVELQEQLELRKRRQQAKEELSSSGRHLWHQIERLCEGQDRKTDLEASAMSLRKLTRDYSGRFKRDRADRLIALVNQLTDEALKLDRGSSIPQLLFESREELSKELDDRELVWK